MANSNEIGLRIVILGAAEARKNIQAAQGDVTKFASALQRVTGVSNELGKTLSSVGSSITSFGRTLTLGITAPLLAAGASLITFGIEFEDAFAGIAKTVEGVADVAADGSLALTAFGQGLSDSIRELALEIPIAGTELAKIGEIAGQLGVRGSEDLLAFIETVGKLGVATSLGTEAAAFGLARLENIMGAVGTEAKTMKEFIERTASTIVALGNNAAATETEILNMTLRLAAAGRMAGLTTPEVLGIATALAEIGIKAESGGTALSRVISEMIFAISDGGDALEGFAQIAGLTTQEFADAFGEDAVATIDLFVAKLAEAQEKGVPGLKDILDDLGLSGVRVRDVLNRLGGDMSLMTDNIELATKAWEENVALTEEASKRFATVKSRIQLLKNRFIDLGITLFDQVKGPLLKFIDRIGELVDKFKTLDDGSRNAILLLAGFAAALGPVGLVIGFVVSGISALISGLGLLVIPLALVVAGIGLLAAKIISLSDSDDLASFVVNMVKEIGDFIANIRGGIDPLTALKNLLFDTFQTDIAIKINEIVGAIAEIIATIAGLATGDISFATILPPELGGVAQLLDDAGQTIRDLISGDKTFLDLIPPQVLTDVIAMRDNISEIATNLSTLKFPGVDPTTSAIFTVMNTFVTTGLPTLQTGLESVSSIFADLSAFAAPFIAAISPKVMSDFAIIVDNFNKSLTALNPTIGQFGETFVALQPIMLTVAKIIGGVVIFALGLLLITVTSLLAGLSQFLPFVVKGFELFGLALEGVGKVITGVVGFIVGLGLAVASFVALVIEAFFVLITGYGDLQVVNDIFVARITAAFSLMGQGASDIILGLFDIISSTVQGIINVFDGMATVVATIVVGWIDGLVHLAKGLWMALVGGSIFPDIATGIIQVFSDLATEGIKKFWEFTSGIGDKAIELAGVVGEALAGLFSGGGGEVAANFSLDFDLGILDGIRTGFESLRTSIASITAELFLFQGSVTGIQLIQAALTLLTTTVGLTALSFTTMSLTAVTGLLLILTTTLTTFTAMQLIWMAGLTLLGTTWALTFAIAGTEFSNFSAAILSSLVLIISGLGLVTASIVIALTVWRANFAITLRSFQVFGLQMIDAAGYMTASVDGITGAFKLLATQAENTKARVCEAAVDMVECMEAAQAGMTSSPTLTIQHPFELFENYLKNSSIPLQLTNILAPAVSLAGQVPVSPTGAGGTTIDESINIGDINGIPVGDKTDIAQAMVNSAKRARAGRR